MNLFQTVARDNTTLNITIDTKLDEDSGDLYKSDKLHDSDCSLHNEPAFPAGSCDCNAK